MREILVVVVVVTFTYLDNEGETKVRYPKNRKGSRGKSLILLGPRLLNELLVKLIALS